MKTAIVILLTAVLSGPSLGQATTTGSATTSGVCSPATTGNNNTYYFQYCGSDPEQGKKMVELLNKILLNHDMADANAKLDQLLKIVSSLGPPKLTVYDAKELAPSPTGHPRMSVDFYTDRPDEGGQFGVLCDRACKPVDICTLNGDNQGLLGNPVDHPEIAAFLFRRQFPALTSFTLSVESQDDKPVKILGMTHLAITDPRTLILNPVQPPPTVFAGGTVMQ